jgi:hypothetical protein
LELARLGIQASNLCMPGSNLHGEIAGCRLGLKLSLCFFGALLLKERDWLMGACQEREIKHAATEKLTIRGEKERDLTCEIPSTGPRLLLSLLEQTHGSVALSVERLKLAAQLIHGTNQQIPLPRTAARKPWHLQVPWLGHRSLPSGP